MTFIVAIGPRSCNVASTAGLDLRKVHGHRHITTTQIYDERRRNISESASHDMPI